MFSFEIENNPNMYLVDSSYEREDSVSGGLAGELPCK